MPFANCTAAYAAGVARIPRGSADYRVAVGVERNGFACENPPAGFVPRTSSTTAVAPVQTGTLPVTGPSAVDVTAGLGVLLVVAGAFAAWRARRRRIRFVA